MGQSDAVVRRMGGHASAAQTQAPPATDQVGSALGGNGDPDGPEQPLSTRRRVSRRGFGSIQSKLLLMLVLTSVLSTIVVGYFGYRSGTQALEDSTRSRLQDVLDERASRVSAMINNVSGGVTLDSQGVGPESMADFSSAYDELARGTVNPADTAALTRYYNDYYAPHLQENLGGEINAEAFIPTSPARTYLQARYTVEATTETDTSRPVSDIDDAGDGSAWTAANKKWNPYWRAVRDSLGLDDVMMIDTDGRIVYTTDKGSDLGSDVDTGELRDGALESLWREALRSNNRDYVAISDYESYQPAFGRPRMFVASPIGTGGDATGVLVYEVSSNAITMLTTGSGTAEKVTGLGETGESYIVGTDGVLRTNSRRLLADPKAFAGQMRENGASEETVDKMLRMKLAVGLLSAGPDISAVAKDGSTGVAEVTDYAGKEVLAAYEPLDVEGLDWSLVATIETEEALAPVQGFARNVLVATAAVILLVCAISILLARVFTRPVGRLMRGVRAVAGGDLGAQVDAGSRDEFGDLATAFNDLSANLAAKQELVDAQQAENSRILRSLMPEAVADRYQHGETTISAEHQNASVVYTEIDGFDAFAGKRPAEESLAMLKELSAGFDAAAHRAGIEKVRSVGTGYIGSSGLIVQRVDHVRRVADFAVDVARMVERFNVTNGANLVLRAGVHTGDVRGGLVGQGDMVYNLWGEAVDLAYRVRTIAGEAGIYVTDEVKNQLSSAYDFEKVGTIDDRPVWQVVLS
ncbi:Adenylate cyclase, class 3 [Nocardioides sp. YR527]|nr:Adenylate cyclase, class 3 [Nocardioides sp. YR527]